MNVNANSNNDTSSYLHSTFNGTKSISNAKIRSAKVRYTEPEKISNPKASHVKLHTPEQNALDNGAIFYICAHFPFSSLTYCLLKHRSQIYNAAGVVGPRNRAEVDPHMHTLIASYTYVNPYKCIYVYTYTGPDYFTSYVAISAV